MPLSDLLERNRSKTRWRSPNALPNEWNCIRRISFGFVPLVFCLLGVSLTLFPRASRANRSWGFMLCLFWLMTYYALLSLGKALGDKNILHPIPALWLPNLVVGGIGTQFFRHALRESPLYFPRALERATASAWSSCAISKRKSKAKKRMASRIRFKFLPIGGNLRPLLGAPVSSESFSLVWRL